MVNKTYNLAPYFVSFEAYLLPQHSKGVPIIPQEREIEINKRIVPDES